VICGEEGNGSVPGLKVGKFAPQFSNGGRGVEQCLGGDSSRAEDKAGLEELYLPPEEGGAGGGFIRLGVAVPRRAAFYHIGNIAVAFPRQPDRGKHLVEELSRPAHKRPAGSVFIGARPFADHHHQGPLRPFAGNGVGSGRAEFARRAAPHIGGDHLQAVVGGIAGQCGGRGPGCRLGQIFRRRFRYFFYHGHRIVAQTVAASGNGGGKVEETGKAVFFLGGHSHYSTRRRAGKQVGEKRKGKKEK